MPYTDIGTYVPLQAWTDADANALGGNWDYLAGAPDVWTPVLTGSTTNPTTNAWTVQEGRYWRLGKFVRAMVHMRANSVLGGSGNMRVSLPVAGRLVPSAAVFPCGSGYIYQSGATTRFFMAAEFLSSDGLVVQFGRDGVSGFATFLAPFSFGSSGDTIALWLLYEAA